MGQLESEDFAKNIVSEKQPFSCLPNIVSSNYRVENKNNTKKDKNKMLVGTQNITSSNWSSSNLLVLESRRLTIHFDSTTYKVSINKKFRPPISWFVTNEEGDLVSLGQIEDNSYMIDLSNLSSGIYYLRIAGEVHMINHQF